MNWILIFIGGGMGSMFRYLISQHLVQSKHFPWATLVSNLLATAFLAALVVYLKTGERPAWLMPLMGIGFCGGFSTFSTFSEENVQLYTQGMWGLLVLNLLISVGGGFGVFWMVGRMFRLD